MRSQPQHPTSRIKHQISNPQNCTAGNPILSNITMSAIQTQRGHDGDTGAERRTTCETAGIVIYTTNNCNAHQHEHRISNIRHQSRTSVVTLVAKYRTDLQKSSRSPRSYIKITCIFMQCVATIEQFPNQEGIAPERTGNHSRTCRPRKAHTRAAAGSCERGDERASC